MINFTDLKNYLQITTTANDALLATMVTATISVVESEIDRTLTSTAYTSEELTYERSRFDRQVNPPLDTESEFPLLFLKNYPVTSLTLTYDTETLTNYSLHTASGVVTMFEFQEDQLKQLRADYTAGYTESTLPNDLKYLIYDGVKEKFENQNAAVLGSQQGKVSSKKVGDFSVSYRGGGNSFLSMGSSVINRYKRWGF